MNHARTQSRQIREDGQAKSRPQLRLIRVRKQSAAASSPGQQARAQTVRIRGDDAVSTVREPAAATGMDTPQADRVPQLAVAVVQPHTGIGREPDQAGGCPIHRIAVNISPPISFPIHIRSISAHVLI